MHLAWLNREHLDDRDVAGAVALFEAARLVDSPHQLVGPTVFSYTVIPANRLGRYSAGRGPGP